MQLSSGTQIPAGLLAAMTLLNEKPCLGVPSKNPAPHQGINERNSTAAIGMRLSEHLNSVRQSERARYYSSTMGRFMSPDWAAKATPVPYAKLDNPQSLNLYAYVGNNPLSHMDPDGHIDCSGKNAQGAGCQAIAQWNQDHGINPNAKKSNFPGVPVKLPNGNTVPDPHSSTGVMMAPTSSLSDVAAAGKKAGQDAQRLDSQSIGGVVFTVELGKAVGTGGQFDDQRMGPQSDVITGGFMQLPQFRDVSNFNVGLFSQQAGMTLDQTLQTAGDFAKHFSSNYSPNSPYGLAPQTAEFIRSGWQAGATQY
jgi:RHS repeat-associated protein